MTINIDALCDDLFNGTPVQSVAKTDLELSTNGQAICEQIHAELPEIAKHPLINPVTGQAFKGHFTCHRADNGSLIGGVVGGNYIAPSLQDLCTIATAATEGLDCDCTAKTHVSNSGHQIIIQASDDQRREAMAGDGLTPRIVINSFLGGKGRLLGDSAAGNDVCDNLMMFQTVANISYKIRHDGGFESNFAQMVKDFQALSANFDDFVGMVDKMSQIEVDIAQIIKAILPTPKETPNAETRYSNIVTGIVARLRDESLKLNESLADGKTSGWRVYNALQGYLQHDASRQGNPSDIDRALHVNYNKNSTGLLATAESLILAV